MQGTNLPSYYLPSDAQKTKPYYLHSANFFGYPNLITLSAGACIGSKVRPMRPARTLQMDLDPAKAKTVAVDIDAKLRPWPPKLTDPHNVECQSGDVESRAPSVKI